ncbi:hypothetical protein [Segetibacter aerophilus]|uniref:Uncharacterized protein n=1 Tax=Segetibacter aerophilus TaxID=670293 RepID=A0A512BIJ9_9BACT|nr:hypothetical protein [Segetibacter aerophilus]GEO11794.1 hypothetical protein SAE01_42900 [Segetibacter aerophilus]
MNVSSLKDSVSFTRFFNKKKALDESVPLDTVEPKEQVKEKDQGEKNTIYLDARNIWITNDGLLRDEGVLFGLTSATTMEKVSAIKNYFLERKAEIDAKKNGISGTVNELINERRKIEAELEQLAKAVVAENLETEKKNTYFFRNLLGLAFITGAAIGSFFLIHFFVTPDFGLAASIGVFLFGLFSLVAPLSTWLNPDDTNNKSFGSRSKVALLEIGSPLATTVFVSYIAYEHTQKIGLTIVIGIFLLFLFFFCGKLLLGVYHNLVEDFKQLLAVRKTAKLSRQKGISDNEAIEKKKKTLEEKITTINTLQSEILKLEAECLSLDQQSELKVNLFMSEYNLARNYSANPNI